MRVRLKKTHLTVLNANQKGGFRGIFALERGHDVVGDFVPTLNRISGKTPA